MIATSTAFDHLERVRKILEEEQVRHLYGSVTVYYQDGRIERVEVKRTTRIADIR